MCKIGLYQPSSSEADMTHRRRVGLRSDKNPVSIPTMDTASKPHIEMVPTITSASSPILKGEIHKFAPKRVRKPSKPLIETDTIWDISLT